MAFWYWEAYVKIGNIRRVFALTFTATNASGRSLRVSHIYTYGWAFGWALALWIASFNTILES